MAGSANTVLGQAVYLFSSLKIRKAAPLEFFLKVEGIWPCQGSPAHKLSLCTSQEGCPGRQRTSHAPSLTTAIPHGSSAAGTDTNWPQQASECPLHVYGKGHWMPGTLIHRHPPPPPLCPFGLAHLSSAYAGPMHSHTEFLQLDTPKRSVTSESLKSN